VDSSSAFDIKCGRYYICNAFSNSDRRQRNKSGAKYMIGKYFIQPDLQHHFHFASWIWLIPRFDKFALYGQFASSPLTHSNSQARMSPPGREDLPVPTFNAEIFGLFQDVITTDEEMGKKAKVIIISPNTHDFESKLSDALEVEISEDSESESEDDDYEQDLSLQDRLDALKYDCNEWEKKLLGGVVLPGMSLRRTR